VTRRWWIVSGAIGGAALLGLAFLAVLFALDVRLSDRWGLVWLIASGGAGIVLGGFLGSFVPRMSRETRTAFAALCGGGVAATVGGLAMLFLGGSEARESHGGRQFVIGAIVGGAAGLALGGLLAARSARDPRPTLRERQRGPAKASLELIQRRGRRGGRSTLSCNPQPYGGDPKCFDG
jgi:MFS family permease